jgi:hypothetical protein
MRKTMIGAWMAVLLAADTGAVSAQDVYVHPARNQTDEQIACDREECHDWAVKQTGVDPEKVAAAVVAPPANGQSSSGAGSELGGAELGAARGAMSGDAAAGAMRGVVIGRLAHAIRARRQMEEQPQASLQDHQQRQTSSRATTGPSTPVSPAAATPCSSGHRLESPRHLARPGPHEGANVMFLRSEIDRV